MQKETLIKVLHLIHGLNWNLKASWFFFKFYESNYSFSTKTLIDLWKGLDSSVNFLSIIVDKETALNAFSVVLIRI